MIHQIETGWVQINDALSKRERRQRGTRARRHVAADEVADEPVTPRREQNDPAKLDIVA